MKKDGIFDWFCYEIHVEPVTFFLVLLILAELTINLFGIAITNYLCSVSVVLC